MMFCRSVSWLICISVAVVMATDYSDPGSIAGRNPEATFHYVRIDTPESPATAEETGAEALSALLANGDQTMLTLVAHDTQLVAHRVVLKERSTVFAAKFLDEPLDVSSVEVTISDVEGPVLRELLVYMYSLEAPQLQSMAPQLLAAADKYGVPGLKAQCEHQLASELAVENAAATAVLAVNYSCPSLLAASVAFIKANLQVLATKGWAEAVFNQPAAVVEVSRLLGERPAQTMALVADEKDERLLQAAEEGADEELQALLAAGADVGARNEKKDRMTALQLAAKGGHLEAVRLLLQAGADVNAADVDDCTALHSAAYRGHTAVVRELLAASADPNARNRWGRTPLHDAAEQGQLEAVAALLEAGADSHATDEDGLTPLNLARGNGHDELIEMLLPFRRMFMRQH